MTTNNQEITEHQKLKYICDNIGYESDFNYDKDGFEQVDVREIIFTPEFMERLENHYINIICGMYYKFEEALVNLVTNNLDNPVEYLYNLITND